MSSIIKTYVSRLLELQNFYKKYQTSYQTDEDIHYLKQEIICNNLMDMTEQMHVLRLCIGKNVKEFGECIKFERFENHMPLDFNNYVEFFITDGFLKRHEDNQFVKSYKNLKEQFLNIFNDVDIVDEDGNEIDLNF